MNERLFRSVDDRVIAGVCGGLADRLALDPSLVRVLWAVVAILTGIFPLLVIYVIMAAVVPEDPKGAAGAWPSPAPPDPAVAPDAAAPPDPAVAPDAAAPPDPAVSPDAAPGPVGATSAGTVDGTNGGAPAPVPPANQWYQGAPSPRRRSGERRERDPLLGIIGGFAIVALGVYFLVRDRIAIDWGVVWAAGLVAVGIVVILAAFRPRR